MAPFSPLRLSGGIAAAGLIAFLAPAAHAQLAYAGGISEIEHAVYGTAPGGAAPLFSIDDGQLIEPGGFYPALAGQVGEVDTGVVGLPSALVTAAGAIPGFGGASTALTPVVGLGRAGIAATNYTIRDANIDGFASTNTFGVSGDFVNTAGVPLAFFGGHFLSFTGFCPLGGYLAVGVRSVFEVGTGIGAGFVPAAAFVPIPIVFAYDSLIGGTRADFIQAGQWLVSTPTLNTVSFAAASRMLIPIPVGATIRMRGTVTLIADPDASVDFADMPLTSGFDMPDMGTGAASNAGAFFNAPEPGSLALGLLGGSALAGILLRRRRSA